MLIAAFASKGAIKRAMETQRPSDPKWLHLALDSGQQTGAADGYLAIVDASLGATLTVKGLASKPAPS